MNQNKVFRIAMEKSQKVIIIYQKKDEIIVRIVTPIVFKGDIISCYDHLKKQRRNYKIDAILGAEIFRND